MEDLKIKTHTTYTYETSDGREFEFREAAEAWQRVLSVCNDIRMLDSNFHSTTEAEDAWYVYIETLEQRDALNTMQRYFDLGALVDGVGYYRYDDSSCTYINIEDEIAKLYSIMGNLKNKEICS